MFWESLLTVEKVYFVIGCVASGLLLVQLILLLIGFGGDGDMDGDVDTDTDSDGGIGIFTIKGIIAFFALGSWISLAASKGGVHWGWTLLIFFVSGTVALVGVGLLYKNAYKLQSSGNIDSAMAIGKIGEVYLTIPANNNGRGKLSVTLQGKLCEIDAVTNDEITIATGKAAKIIGVIGDTYIVEAYKADAPDANESTEIVDANLNDNSAMQELKDTDAAQPENAVNEESIGATVTDGKKA